MPRVLRPRTAPLPEDASPEWREMRSLLRYASFAEVGRALDLSRNAVSDWWNGHSITPWRLRQVRELMQRSEHEEAAPPRWARELHAKTLKALRASQGDAALLEKMIVDAEAQARPPAVEPRDYPPGDPDRSSSKTR